MRNLTKLIRTITFGILITLISSQLHAQFGYPYKEKLTDTEKLYGLSLFWSEVNYNFAFFHQVPKLNWNKTYQEYIPKVLATKNTKEYYDVLSQFCALLQDGHTNVYYPRPILKTFANVPIKWTNIDQRAFVTNVGQSLAKKIPLGSELIKVNDQPTKDFLLTKKILYIASSTDYIRWDKAIRYMMVGKAGESIKLTFKTPNDKEKTLELTREQKKVEWVKPVTKRALLEFKWLKNKVAYVAINSFSNNNIQQEFPKLLPELYKAKGVIIDVRRNGGGSGNNASFVVKHFTNQKVLLGARWQTREHRAAHKAWGAFVQYRMMQNPKYKPGKSDKKRLAYFQGKAVYIGDTSKTKNHITAQKITAPLVVLTGHNTASAAEDFLIYLDNLKRATRVGRKTFGSTGQPLFVLLPGGGRARICTKNDTFPDGKEFIGYGIQPHVEINPGVNDFVKNNDVILKKGLEVLKEKMKNSNK